MLAFVSGSARVPIPLAERRIDLVFVAFFVINLTFITYIVDVEQIVIDDPYDFEYPLWPLPAFVDLVHWWGRSFDPPLMAREAWWRATIWIDALFFGPFYALAIYAYVKAKDWIRMPSVIWASVMMTNVTVILFEEVGGNHATESLGLVLVVNAPWLLVPIAVLLRMWRPEHPFTRPAASEGT